MPRLLSRLVPGVTALLLASCASYAPPPSAFSSLPQQYSVSGKVAVNAAGKGYSARFSWRHQQAEDAIDISNPLGQIVARLEIRPDGAVFTDADGHQYLAADVEALSERELGWRLPASGLRYWLLGLADPASSARWENSSEARVLWQQGWRIQYPADARGTPSKLSLKHADLEVRIALHDWQIPPAP